MSIARMADQIGLTQKDVANDMLVSLSSSGQTAPNYWVNPKSGINYSILVQTPQYHVNSMNELENTPVVPAGTNITPDDTQLLGNLASTNHGIRRPTSRITTSTRTFDVQMGVATARTWARSPSRCRRSSPNTISSLPRGTTINLRGQVQSMESSFTGLGLGLIFAIVLVYLLMVINFQSWIDPVIILMALPGRLVGNSMDALFNGNDDQRARADGRDHEHRRGDGEQHSDDHVRQRSAQGTAWTPMTRLCRQA